MHDLAESHLRGLHGDGRLERDAQDACAGEWSVLEEITEADIDRRHEHERLVLNVFEPGNRHDVRLSAKAQPDRDFAHERVPGSGVEEQSLLEGLQREC